MKPQLITKTNKPSAFKINGQINISSPFWVQKKRLDYNSKRK